MRYIKRSVACHRMGRSVTYHTLSSLILTEQHVPGYPRNPSRPTYAPRRPQEARPGDTWLRHACHSCRVRTRSEHWRNDTCHLFEHDVQAGRHWEKQGKSGSTRNRDASGVDGYYLIRGSYTRVQETPIATHLNEHLLRSNPVLHMPLHLLQVLPQLPL